MELWAIQEALTLGALFILSALVSRYLTPLIRQSALNYNVLDHPDTELKNHPTPVPYLGGIAIYLAFLITLAISFDFTPHSIGLLLGGTMVAMLGLFDDLRVLPAALKLAIQLLVVWVVIKSNISIQLVDIPSILSIPLTVFWLIGITNSVNILDVSDGLASSTSAIASSFFFLIALINGNFVIAALSAALTGSLLGFFSFNKEPASIYLGDTGSLFIGFMLASLGMIGSYTQSSLWGIIAPIAILIVPIFDTTLCSLARLHKGISPMRGSDDHFALRLKNRGYRAKSIAYGASCISILSGLLGLGAIFSSPENASYLAFGLLTAFILTLVYFLARLPPPSAALKESSKDH